LRNSFDQEPHYLPELDEAEALGDHVAGGKNVANRRQVSLARSLIKTKTSGRRDLLSAGRRGTLINQKKGKT
jgi:hypothetical protein